MVEQYPNILRYMRVVQVFNKNDLDTVKQICSEKIMYRIAGRSPQAGEYHGIKQFGRALNLAEELSDGTFAFEPQTILADNQAVIAYGHATTRREGKMLDIDNIYLYRFNEEGKIIEGRTIPVDLYAFDEFWS